MFRADVLPGIAVSQPNGRGHTLAVWSNEGKVKSNKIMTVKVVTAIY